MQSVYINTQPDWKVETHVQLEPTKQSN